MDAPPIRAIHQIVDRVKQRPPLRPPGVKQRQIRLFPLLNRADFRLQPQSFRPADRCQFQRRLRRDYPHILPRILIQRRRQIHCPHCFQQVRVVPGVRPQSHRRPRFQQLRQHPLLRQPGPALNRRRRTHNHLGAIPRNALHLRPVNAQTVRQRQIRPQHPQRFQILRRPHPVIPQTFLNILRTVIKMQRHPGLIPVRQPLGRSQQFRRGKSRRKRHRPSPHPSLQPPVILPNNPLHPGHRLPRLIHRQVKRIRLIRNLPAHNNPAPRFPIGLPTRRQPLGTPRIQKTSRPILQQLRNRQQRSIVFLLLRHRRLQLENIRQIIRPQVVRKDAPHRMGITDMQMPIDEPRRNHHLPGINHPLRRNIRQLRRLAHPADPLPLNQNRAIPDNPPARVHRKNKPRILNFQRSCRHNPSPSNQSGAKPPESVPQLRA